MSMRLPPPPPTCSGQVYTLRSGDTLYSLSRKFGVTVQAIINTNPQITDVNRLQIGQQICIPGAQPQPPTCAGQLYTVRAGDTLSAIASRFGVTLQAIISANPQITDPNRLSVGQQVCIPVVLPRLCSLALSNRTENTPGPEAGGVLWLQNISNQTQLLVAGINLPDPTTLGENTYTALLSWERTTFDLPLIRVPSVPGLWVGYTSQPTLPAAFFRTGSVDIFPGPVAGGLISSCR